MARHVLFKVSRVFEGSIAIMTDIDFSRISIIYSIR